jgi:hypothetical protein
MKRIAVALAALVGLADTAHAQQLQPADCPNSGDTCVVPFGNDFLDFPQPFSGAFSDTIVLGRLDLLWGPTLVACVNGQVQFSRDGAGYTRSVLTRNSVVCAGSGNDVVKVLAAGETQTCSYYGLPFTMTAFQYGAYELAIYGQGGADQITGGDGSDQLCGGSGNDRIWGRNGMNELNGGVGNDDLYGGSDIDWLYGADGDDLVIDAAGTGGYRRACFAGGQQVPPSRIEGGSGNDCLQVAQFEDGWCYSQEEACDGNQLPCHGGIYCAAGYDRIDTPGPQGLGCEVRTNGLACTR